MTDRDRPGQGKSNAIQAAVVDALVRLGTPADDGPARYGWIADSYSELRMHMAGCRPAYDRCTWADSHWQEFQNTLDPDITRQGIDLMLTCSCGTVTGQRWRYDGGYAPLVRAITGG